MGVCRADFIFYAWPSDQPLPTTSGTTFQKAAERRQVCSRHLAMMLRTKPGYWIVKSR